MDYFMAEIELVEWHRKNRERSVRASMFAQAQREDSESETPHRSQALAPEEPQCRCCHSAATSPTVAGPWKKGPMREILATFLKIGATAYGGPAIMGLMQAEFQERRQWLTKAQFVEGLAFANMLPGATATQLGIFLGYRRAGWWGGLLAGLCFCAPAFAIMLALTLVYSAFGVSPVLRGALYGLGPIVLAVFGVAVYRLGHTALQSSTHVVLAAG